MKTGDDRPGDKMRDPHFFCHPKLGNDVISMASAGTLIVSVIVTVGRATSVK